MNRLYDTDAIENRTANIPVFVFFMNIAQNLYSQLYFEFAFNDSD